MTQQTEIQSDNLVAFKQLAESKGGKCLTSSFTNSRTKLLFECKNGHQWYAFPNSIIKGHWCQKCFAIENATRKRDKLDDFKKIAISKGGRCLSDSYSNQKDKLLFECINGHQWLGRAANIKRGDWCRTCSYEIIAQKRKESGNICNRPLLDLSKMQSIAMLKGGKLITDEYKNVTTKMLWECSEKHQWWTTAQNIRAGSWCKKCSSRKAKEYLTKSITDCRELAASHNGLCLSDLYTNNHSKLTWQCEKGHTWQASFANIKKGTWCKECARKELGKKRSTSIEYFRNYAISRNGICLSETYKNQKSILSFQCSEGHIWNAQGGSIKGRKTWCPICAGTYKADTPELEAERLNEINKIAQNHGGECLSKKYINTKTKLQFKCDEGHIWWTVPSVIKNGNWCNICASKRTSDNQRDNIELFRKLIESKGGKCLTTEYISQEKTKFLVECEEGHRWYAFPQHLKRGIWCRKCNGSAPHELADIIRLAESRGGKCLSSVYKNDMTKIMWQCAENHIWEASPNNIKRGKWCPTCNSGIGERVCRLSLEKIFNVDFNKVRPSWLRNKAGFVLELDGYNESLKLAFEHQGTQHYSLKTNQRFVKANLILNDKEKAEICKKNGISIIYIPEVFTDTKLKDLIPFLLNQITKLKIQFPHEAQNIVLDPKEVYTYTKTKEVEARERRALELLQNHGANVISIFRVNSGVKLKVACANNHILTSNISSILNGIICRKCSAQTTLKDKERLLTNAIANAGIRVR